MYTEKDHLLGHLLAAALELMVGEKALIAFSGGCPYGFYTDVFPPFPLGAGYLAPLKDHMENFIRKKDLKTYVMEKKNAEAFLAHRNKKRTLKKLQETVKETVVLLQIQESFFILDQEPTSLELKGDFTLDRIDPLERGGFRFYGKGAKEEPKKNFHLQELKNFGIWHQKEFLWNRAGCKLKKDWILFFEKWIEREGGSWIDTGFYSKETFKKVKELDILFSFQWTAIPIETKSDPFFGLKGLEVQTSDRFFYLVENENVRDAMSSCLRLIEKWTKILGIRGNFTDRDKGRVSWMVQDPFGAVFEGPHVERHPSGCLTGSIMGPLELLIAIHAEEKFTWNLENQE